MKKQMIQEVAAQLKSYGYAVYIAASGEHGFYTDGVKVVSFSVEYFALKFSGNYSSRAMHTTGTGWGIAKDLGGITDDDAERFIRACAPQWATKGNEVKYTTPEQHLKMYPASGYTEFK